MSAYLYDCPNPYTPSWYLRSSPNTLTLRTLRAKLSSARQYCVAVTGPSFQSNVRHVQYQFSFGTVVTVIIGPLWRGSQCRSVLWCSGQFTVCCEGTVRSVLLDWLSAFFFFLIFTIPVWEGKRLKLAYLWQKLEHTFNKRHSNRICVNNYALLQATGIMMIAYLLCMKPFFVHVYLMTWAEG